MAPLRACRSGSAARMSRNGPRTLTSIIASQAASLVFSIVPVVIAPAAFTSTSRPPNPLATPTMRSGAASAVTSAAHMTGRRPSTTISSETSRSAASSRPTSTRSAPSRANPAAAARPIPLVAPVTITTFPVKDMCCSVVRRLRNPTRRHPMTSSDSTRTARVLVRPHVSHAEHRVSARHAGHISQNCPKQRHQRPLPRGRNLATAQFRFGLKTHYGATTDEMYSPQEIARAAGVPVARVISALGDRDRFVSHAAAVELGRRLKHRGLFSIFDEADRHPHPRAPLALSSTLHGLVLAIVVTVFSLAPNPGAAPLEDAAPPPADMRLVFLSTPGPGGGGGGGGALAKTPPPKALRKGPRAVSSPLPIRKAPEPIEVIAQPPE